MTTVETRVMKNRYASAQDVRSVAVIGTGAVGASWIALFLAEIDAAAAPEKIILSSTGGLSPSEMQRACRHPERLVVLHPFNPAHLIRLVEVVGGRETAPEVLDWADAFARRMGKVPIRLNT